MISKRRKQRVTKKKASIKLGNTWPNYIVISFISIILGFGIGFNIFNGGEATTFILRIGELEAENKSLEDNLVKRNLDIKLQNMSVILNEFFIHHQSEYLQNSHNIVRQ